MNNHVTAIIVDDAEIMRSLLRAYLEELDVEVVGEAENGRQGVDMAIEVEPDIIFLDIMMPVMNGYLALEEIIGRVPNAFVVMLTAVEDKEVKAATRLGGAQDYILKTLPGVEMLEHLGRHVTFLRNRRR